MFLDVSQLQVQYAGRDRAAVEAVSFGLRAGDIGVLIGPSGCGKTTLLRADDIVHDDAASVKAEIVRKAFRGSEFLYTLRLQNGQTVLAHVPSHHDHKLGEWIGIRPEVDHVVTFSRA